MAYVRGARRSSIIKPLPIHVPDDAPEPVGSRLSSIPGPKPVFDPLKCGTLPGYKQHHRHGQEPCGPCKAVNAEASRRSRVPKPRVLKPCGTHAAYTRHIKAGEKPCAPCLAGHAAYEAKNRRGANGRLRLIVAPLNPAKCGTYAGYKAHTNRGQKACQPCSAARTEYYLAQKAAQQERSAA